MPKLEQTLYCHLHIPLSTDKDKYLTEASRNRLITPLLIELRSLRIPKQVLITTDGYDSVTGSKLSIEYLQTQLTQIVRNLLPFYEPAILKQWPSRLSEEHPITHNVISDECFCALCKAPNYTNITHQITLYSGNINDLIRSIPYTSNSKHNTKSVISFSSRISLTVKPILASIIDITEDFDTDQPLDYLVLCSEDELHTFLNTFPGTEADDEDTHDLPPPQPGNPLLLF